MKNKIPKKINSTLILLIVFILIIGLGVFFMLLTLNVIKGKAAPDWAMWSATAFCFAIGGIGLISTIKAAIKEKIRRKKNSKEDEENGENIPEEVLVFKNAIPELNLNKGIDISNKEKKNYIFKQVRQSIVKFVLYDESKNLVYDSKRVNKTFFTPLKISFNNHISNKSFYHIIGRALVSDMNHNNTYFIPAPYTYRIDDLKVEDFFKRLNIQLIGRNMNCYDINYKGSLIGSIDIIKDKKLNLLGKKVNDMKINCIEEYIDIAFLSAFAIGYATHMSNY